MLEKSWLEECPTSTKFRNGLISFLDFAEFHSTHKMEPNRLPCPCSKCKNVKYEDRLTIMSHVTRNNFDNNYRSRTWYMHGELIPGSRAHKRLLKRKHHQKEGTSNTPPLILENEMVRLVTEAMIDPLIDPTNDMINIDPIDDLGHDPIDHPIDIPCEDHVANPIDDLNDDSNFARRLRDANKDLYSGCSKYSK